MNISKRFVSSAGLALCAWAMASTAAAISASIRSRRTSKVWSYGRCSRGGGHSSGRCLGEQRGVARNRRSTQQTLRSAECLLRFAAMAEHEMGATKP